MRRLLFAAVVALLPQPVLAWGYMGHNLIGKAAARNFPASLPPFLRGPEAEARLGILSQEPDTSRNAGEPHDYDLDPGHFLDVSDDMTILGGPKVSALPLGRRDYDTALRAVNSNQYAAGYLPYNVLDGYQQLVKDFALLRAYQASLKYAARFHATAADRKGYARLLELRRLLTWRDLGYWAHFVEDMSQPMHVSVHYNGWGTGPNPNGYVTAPGIHSKFEADFVTANIAEADIFSHMRPAQPCGPRLIACVEDYILREAAQVETVYRFEKAGALDTPTPEAKDFTAQRLADGASMLRDMVADAWAESATALLGYKVKTPVADYESGKAIMILQSKD